MQVPCSGGDREVRLSPLPHTLQRLQATVQGALRILPRYRRGESSKNRMGGQIWILVTKPYVFAYPLPSYRDASDTDFPGFPADRISDLSKNRIPDIG
jgi:hypothetical protein